MSSIDDENLTSDQACSITEEEHSSVGDVLDGTLASEGNGGFDGPFGAGNAEAAHAFCSGNRSRSNDVRSNAPRSLFDGDYTREGVNTSLSGGHVGLVWVA